MKMYSQKHKSKKLFPLKEHEVTRGIKLERQVSGINIAGTDFNKLISLNFSFIADDRNYMLELSREELECIVGDLNKLLAQGV